MTLRNLRLQTIRDGSRKTLLALSLIWLLVLMLLRCWPQPGGIIQMQILAEKNGVAQWFFDRGDGYSEAESATAGLQAGDNKISFELPRGTYTSLRFDPTNNDGWIAVNALNWVVNPSVDSMALGKENLQALADIVRVEARADGVLIQPLAGSGDPQMNLPLPQPLRLVRIPELSQDAITAFEWACAALLALLLVKVKLPTHAVIVIGMSLAAGLIVAIAMLSSTTQSMHPDEYSHMSALHYFAVHWWPPAINDPAVVPSLSIYGTSYLSELDVNYPIAARVISPIITLAGSEMMAARIFQCSLWAILCVLAWRKKSWAIALAIALVTPQIWYVFSYFNADAFPLFLTLIAATLVADGSGSLQAYILGRRGMSSAVVVFAICLGLILISKRNFLPLVPGLLLWLAVLHLDLRWRELLASLFGLALLGFSVFAPAIPMQDAWYSDISFALLGAAFIGFAAIVVVLRCWRDAQRKAVLARLLLVIGIIFAVVIPRLALDIWMNGTPATKAANIMAVAEAHAGEQFKPSVIAQGKGFAMLGLAHKGVTLHEIIFDPYQWGKMSRMSAFGVYGHMNIYADENLYWWLIGAAVLLIIIGSTALVRADPAHATRLLAVVFGICILIAGSSLLHSWVDDLQRQGRYLLPMAGMLALLLGHGSNKLPQRTFNAALLFAVGLSLYSFAAVALPALAR
ncbi:hypothetical protein ELE36_09525 [Pseudolysobacter antarcticus]|uniref:DUF2142 domain-containing protein n=1 Tax=Pseudolysobacter antarcticus TaxID=2511995 RepID=A0A411HJ74_9GAMM|nr:hypothetical protein [Pseudolysobacter antarcticus]QBB70586.1 hypothetical protein ELE36_09525 [Pseudolysobacter antarcticus]